MRPIVLVVLGAALLFGEKSARVDQAWEFISKSKRAEAASLLVIEIGANPDNADARLLLGGLLTEGGQLAEAITHLIAGVRLRPNSAAAHNALGEALSAGSDWKAARDHFRMAVSLDAKFARAHENLGLVLLETKDYVEAGTHLDRAIQLWGAKKEAAYARYLRAKVHAESGEMKTAAHLLQQAVSVRPELAEAWSDLGQARETLGDETGALAALRRSIALNPDGSIAQRRIGSLYLRMDKPEQALPHLKKAAELQPDDQTALNSLQLAFRATGRAEEASKVRHQLAQIFRSRDQKSTDALQAVKLNNEGAELQKQGDLVAATQKYEAAVRLNPEHAGMRVNYAVALLRLGRWEQGLEQMRTAVRQDPSNETFKRALDDALAQAPAHIKTTR